MSGTALYRALIDAGAKEELAEKAVSEIDDIRDDITEIKERLTRVETMLKIVIGLICAVLLILIRIAFAI